MEVEDEGESAGEGEEEGSSEGDGEDEGNAKEAALGRRFRVLALRTHRHLVDLIKEPRVGFYGGNMVPFKVS